MSPDLDELEELQHLTLQVRVPILGLLVCTVALIPVSFLWSLILVASHDYSFLVIFEWAIDLAMIFYLGWITVLGAQLRNDPSRAHKMWTNIASFWLLVVIRILVTAFLLTLLIQ